MKPGDLVQVFGAHERINSLSPKMGLVIGPKVDWSSTRFPVLIGGEIMYPAEFEITLIEESNETR